MRTDASGLQKYAYSRSIRFLEEFDRWLNALCWCYTFLRLYKGALKEAGDCEGS